jgi:activator of HSP90 ATPase
MKIISIMSLTGDTEVRMRKMRNTLKILEGKKKGRDVLK